jgi:hypothetical protein
MHIGSFIGQEHVLGVNTAALKNWHPRPSGLTFFFSLTTTLLTDLFFSPSFFNISSLSIGEPTCDLLPSPPHRFVDNLLLVCDWVTSRWAGRAPPKPKKCYFPNVLLGV